MVDGLRLAGASVVTSGKIRQPFFPVTGRILVLNGQDVQVFQFTDEAAALSAAVTVSADGNTIGSAMMAWIAEPHFYCMRRVIGEARTLT